MILSPGSKLGPYEILEPLGAGGMGEVWKARDSRLDRLVAVKILSAHLSGEPEMRQRLEREARAVAALSHPNICVLHDVGEMDGRAYLVMELLEGESLASRIERGPLPFDLVLKTATQIAAALEKAHRQGIVHRDLKPGNVMLTPGGAKLLDFGLARLGAPVLSGPAPGRSPAPAGSRDTITREGMVVGTYQYMAPEQLEGGDVDARSDIFALGGLIYEMATGRQPFAGRSQASVISAILSTDPPPISTLRPGTPAGLERLVKTCLAKDPEERWQSAHDVKRELEWIAEESASGNVLTAPLARPTPPGPARRRAAPRTVAAALAGAVVAAAAVAAAFALRHAPAGTAPPSVRFVIDLPPGDTAGTLMRSALAFAPDGRRLAFVGIHGGDRQLYIRELGSLEMRPLPGTDRADAPFFSPDGGWLGFFADGKLRKISLATEVVTAICDASEGRGGSWAEDGTILFAPSTGAGLMRVDAQGGTPNAVTTLDAAAGENSHRWPEFLPGGRAALFTIRTARIESFDEAKIAACDLATGKVHPLVNGGTRPYFLAPGTLLYARSGVVYGVPFDPSTLKVTGAERKVVDGVSTNPTAGGVSLAASRSGALAWIAGSTQVPKVSLRWVSASGEEPPLGEFRRRLTAGTLSPDRSVLVLRIAAANDDLWTFDVARRNLARLTSEPGDEVAPIFSPDGRLVTFAAAGGRGGRSLFTIAADGSARPVPLRAAVEDETPTSWTPDGRTLFLDRPKGLGGGDIMTFTPSENALRPFLATGFRERSAMVSPGGEWVAYVSNESGRDEVTLQAYPGPGGKWTISTNGGDRPLWISRRELSFRSEGKRVAVTLAAAPAVRVSAPRVLFDEPYLEVYGASEDGRRFLVLKNDEPLAPARQILVQLGAVAAGPTPPPPGP